LTGENGGAGTVTGVLGRVVGVDGATGGAATGGTGVEPNRQLGG
jgi:hypothetical protein